MNQDKLIDPLSAPQPLDRRTIIKKMAYASPVVLTIANSPSFAAAGSATTTGGGKQPGSKICVSVWGRTICFTPWW